MLHASALRTTGLTALAAAAVLVNAVAAGPLAATGEGDPGIHEDRILFGQSAALSGPAGQLGLDMRLGIRAAFHEANAAGGVHGRNLQLTTLNDSYEPNLAFSNTQRLLRANRVFALIGAVGTPTSRAAVPVAQDAGVPFLAPFTGAEFLRDPTLDKVVNLRASYYQETEEMVARLTEDLGVMRIAVFYQNDSFGEAGLEGVRRALQRRNMSPVAAWSYERNTTGIKRALLGMIESEPEAVILVGAYAPVAELVVMARRKIDPVFMSVSFVGSEALLAELGVDGAGLYITQVVPAPHDNSVPVVAAYREALAGYDPDASPGYVSLEGYLAGRLAVAGLGACGRTVSRACFLDAFRTVSAFDIDGFELNYGPGDNQGSDAVFVTVIDEDGELHQVDKLTGTR